jgi:nicotinamide-nucleotide amidase
MRAELISIGTELLLGEITDTNAQYISARLPALGIDLYFVSQVGDNFERLSEVIGRAWQRSDLVITTGGLGPTEDDLTREAIASVVGEEMTVDPELESNLREFFARRGVAMPERNLKQATVVASGRAIPNPRGTAPGWWVEKEGRVIAAMPGPPSEMQRMWEKEVAPELERRHRGAVLITRTLKTAGLGEGHIDEMISPFLKSKNPTIGVYAKQDGVHLRIGAKATTMEDALRLIEPVEADLRRVLGEVVWGVDDETLASVVGSMLRQQGLTIATMESCTGGLLADTITDVPGSSDYFRGGVVSYATEAKKAWGVDATIIDEFGVISSECAIAMARAARGKLDADVGIGITGVAGPDPQESKPPGTVHIGLDVEGVGPQTVGYQFAQGREAVKRRAVTTALAMLRRALIERSRATS